MYDEEEVPFYNVLLLGMVGHGKTSVVNTMASAIIGEVTSLTPAGSAAGGTSESVTRTVSKQLEAGDRDRDECIVTQCCT